VFDPSEAIDLDAIRARLRKMTDRELLEYGHAGAYMVSLQASYGPTRPTFIIQYAETRAEWRRRRQGISQSQPL
jgi:hypothetical protein